MLNAASPGPGPVASLFWRMRRATSIEVPSAPAERDSQGFRRASVARPSKRNFALQTLKRR